MQQETVGLVIVTVLARLLALVRLMLLRLLPAGDEGRQPLTRLRWSRCPAGDVEAGVAAAEGLCIARDVRLRLARTIG